MNSTISDEGLVFTLDADTDKGIPIYRQIIRQIEYAILSGRALPGDKLPTIRSLAVELRINPNTIAKAYGELEIRGVLATQVGRGTYVSDQAPLLGEALNAEEGLARKVREVVGRFVQDMQDLGVEGGELISAVKKYIDGKEQLSLSGDYEFEKGETK
jgi:GntR family transcriptional regulator